LVRCLVQPYYIVNAALDDELMVRMAQGFLHGHWSTSWSASGASALVKSIGYPMFLAAAHFLPWSPLITVYLLYVTGAVLIALGWRSLSGSRWQAGVVLAALTLAPFLYARDDQRIYRDSYIQAVATVAIGLSFLLASRLFARRGRPIGNGVLLVMIGLCVGVEAIVKPSWYWLVPAIVAPLAYPLWRRFMEAPRRLLLLGWALAGALVVAVGAFSVVESTVKMNKAVYGVGVVDDLSQGQFPRAWKMWVSVEAGPRPQWYDPINGKMRLAVYRVSPAARLIEPYFQVPTDGWRTGSCERYRIIPCDGSGYWTIWDLRSSAVSAGQAQSATQFQAYFKQVADQISQACSSGELRCDSSPVLGTGVLPLDDLPTSGLTRQGLHGLWEMVLSRYSYSSPPAQAQPTGPRYREWASVVPGMPAITQLTYSTPSPVYPILRHWSTWYGDLNVVALIGLALAMIRWVVVRLTGRHLAIAGWPVGAMIASGWFFVSAVLGLAILAILGSGVPNAFVTPLYWSDFATPVELFIVFGAFAAAGILTQKPSPKRRRKLIPPNLQEAADSDHEETAPVTTADR
jgi:hypothetical protein